MKTNNKRSVGLKCNAMNEKKQLNTQETETQNSMKQKIELTSEVIVLNNDQTLIFPSMNGLKIISINQAVRQQRTTYRRETEVIETRYNKTTQPKFIR